MSNTPAYVQDTIVAAATPPGIGGIAIVRVSGAEAEKIATVLSGSLPSPRQAVFATFRSSSGEALDNGVTLYFPAPKSFTGESVVEFHGHGGPMVVSAIVDAIIEQGARHAKPGEFSKRAFLNNKLDLAQAEAISDLIGSGTRQAARAALRSLAGAFSKSVEALQLRLTELRLHVEAALDFPEEEIDFLADEVLLKKTDDCELALDQLLEEASAGRVLRDGVQMVIIGRPNAGKSSLLNLLSGQEAAIVTEVAGTTRDILRERIDIDGLAVELVDTAGLRADPDRIEAEGIRRARDVIRSADAIVWIRDASDDIDEAINDLEPDIDVTKPVITVRNKCDLTKESAGLLQESPAVVAMSAKTGDGLSALRREIRRTAGYHDLGEGAYTTRQRHLNAIEATREHFISGRDALTKAKAGEIFAEELRLAQQSLGEITGEFTSDELLGRIFSEFCIGK